MQIKVQTEKLDNYMAQLIRLSGTLEDAAGSAERALNHLRSSSVGLANILNSLYPIIRKMNREAEGLKALYEVLNTVADEYAQTEAKNSGITSGRQPEPKDYLLRPGKMPSNFYRMVKAPRIDKKTFNSLYNTYIKALLV